MHCPVARMAHYLVQKTAPKRILLGCAGCGEPGGVIHGATAHEQMKACVIRHTESPFFDKACCRQSCFENVRKRHEHIAG